MKRSLSKSWDGQPDKVQMTIPDGELETAERQENTEPKSSHQRLDELYDSIALISATEVSTSSAQGHDETFQPRSVLDLSSKDGPCLSKSQSSSFNSRVELAHASSRVETVNSSAPLGRDNSSEPNEIPQKEEFLGHAPVAAQIIAAMEDMGKSPAIPLTAELLGKLQHTVLAYRQVSAAEHRASKRQKLAQAYIDKIDDAMTLAEDRWISLDRMDREHWNAAYDAELNALQQELDTLSQWRRRTERTFEDILKGMYLKYHWFFDLQREATTALDRVLTECNMLDSEEYEPEPTGSDLDFKKDFTFPEKGAKPSPEPTPQPPWADDELAPTPPVSPRQIPVKKDPYSIYWDYISAFRGAQYRFDEREVERERSLIHREKMAKMGRPLSETQTQFDCRQRVRYQHLTRELILAEAALDQAKHAAFDARVQLRHGSQESCFVDNVNDGYRVSEENEEISTVSRPRIEKWIDLISSSESETNPQDMAPSEVDADSWDDRSVEFNESNSAVAEGWVRKKIDSWKNACATLPHVQSEDEIAALDEDADRRLERQIQESLEMYYQKYMKDQEK